MSESNCLMLILDCQCVLFISSCSSATLSKNSTCFLACTDLHIFWFGLSAPLTFLALCERLSKQFTTSTSATWPLKYDFIASSHSINSALTFNYNTPSLTVSTSSHFDSCSRAPSRFYSSTSFDVV